MWMSQPPLGQEIFHHAPHHLSDESQRTKPRIRSPNASPPRPNAPTHELAVTIGRANAFMSDWTATDSTSTLTLLHTEVR